MALQLTAAAVPRIGPDFVRFVADRQRTEFSSYFGELEEPHPSTVLMDHSEPGHRLGELYDKMLENDPVLAGLWEKRWKAVIGLPREIVPRDSSPLAIEVAEFCRRALSGVPNLHTNLAHQLEAVPKGIAFDELRWEQQTRGDLAGAWIPVEVVDRPMWRFAFKDGVPHVRTRENALQPVAAGRLLYMRHGSKDTPWGRGLLDRVWWFYWLTLHAWKYYGVAIEKWAQPTPIGKYKRDTTGTPDGEVANQKAIDALLTAIASIQTEFGIVVPDDTVIDTLGGERSGTVSYEAFITLLDRAKALVMLGEIDTSGLAKGPGSFAKNRVSNDVRLETIQIDAHELATHLTDNLLTPLVRVNYGLDAPVPRWWIDIDEADDRKLRQAGVAAVRAAGLPTPTAYFYRVHQVPLPKDGEPVVAGEGSAAEAPERIPSPRPRRAAPAAAESWDEQELAA